MLNSDAFLDAFSAIEKWLRKEAGSDSRAPFYQLVERVSANSRVVSRYRNDLKEFADLRNAVVHERTDGHVIAEPNKRAVMELAHIREVLIHPPAIIPKFQRPVRTRSMVDSVGEAVIEMRKGSFSQLPILSGTKVVSVLTAETVTRWLASESPNEVVSLWDTKIEEVLRHTEDPENHCFLSGKATLVDAVSSFESFLARGKDLNAILITQGGRADQALIGILTHFDLPTILLTLGLKRVSAT